MTSQTHSSRVLAIGLDGYEASVGDALMAAGDLPALARLRDQSARFLLDHGSAQRTGLAWEHFSTGRSPQAAHRWSAVSFDPSTYEVWQDGTTLEPFAAHLSVPTVVFDPPYFDLDSAPSASGVVSWGAHDPGVARLARPAELHSELNARCGAYAADEFTYGIAWPSAERARRMSSALVRAVDRRAQAATWLLRARLPDWRLAIVVSGELHSAIEGLWHGIDATHPLHHLPSAAPAGEGLRAVYRAVDGLVGRLVETFGDAKIVAFAMGGMGPNRSDVASMLLLPELLYRYEFRRPLFRDRRAWTRAEDGIPILAEDEDWATAINIRLRRSRFSWARRVAAHVVPRPVKDALRSVTAATIASPPSRTPRLSIDWMPASRYQPSWREMRFFALPSFYDGRIRINLCGRERDGKVPQSHYGAACEEVEELVRACRDTRTGEPVVETVERCSSDPLGIGPSESDLVVVWRGSAVGFHHSAVGRIGPVPFRRTGGHTGKFGVAYVRGEGIQADDYGVRSSFDVVPTIVDLLGEPPVAGLSGRSLMVAPPTPQNASSAPRAKSVDQLIRS